MKSSREVLSSVLKTAQMGQVGIRSVMKIQIEDSLRRALREQLSQYDSVEREAYSVAAARGWELEPLDPAAKAMAAMTTRARLAYGDVNSKVAAMMIQGNTRGMLKGLKNLHGSACSDSGVQAVSRSLLDYEKSNIEKMQPFV